MSRVLSPSVRALAGFGVALAALSIAPAALAQERYAAIVLDARTNEVLHADAADEQRFPASLTKMMTLYMLFDAMERGQISASSTLTASRHAAAQPPTRLGLRRGNTITVDQAIRALCVQSANDVAVMLAERLGGTETRFAARMTTRARELGMAHTNFANASGLPNPQQRTTARDMAILSQALWRDFPQYYHYFQTASFSWRNHYGRNHNRLLNQIEGVDGIKTGYTQASGFNLASSAERDGRRVIVVVMGGATAAARDAQVAHLLEDAFTEYAQRQQMQPNTATFVGLPVNHVDAQINSGGGVVTNVSQTFGPTGAPLRGSYPSASAGAPITYAAPAAQQPAQAETMAEDQADRRAISAIGATGAQ
ncbi:MAG: D-alanyl-D-alanine carboxypeptidase family protein [Hyphomonadaceae bacterium]